MTLTVLAMALGTAFILLFIATRGMRTARRSATTTGDSSGFAAWSDGGSSDCSPGDAGCDGGGGDGGGGGD